jgi:DNA primase
MDKLETLKNIPILDIAEKLGIATNGKKPIPCPFHNEKTPSFVLGYKDSNKFKCFGCDIGGTSIDLILETLGTKEIPQAIKWAEDNGFLTGHYHAIPARKHAINEPKASQRHETRLGKEFNEIYEYFLNLLPFPAKDSYLIKDRHLSYETLEKNNIRAINKDYKNILLEKFSESDLLASGLLSKKENVYFSFYDCLAVIPFYQDGKIVYLQGRGKPDANRKNVFLTNLTPPLVYIPKLSEAKEVYITEGIITGLSLLGDNLNSISLLTSNSVKEEILKDLEPLKDKLFLFCPDIDKGGKQAFEKLANLFFINGFTYEPKMLNARDIGRRLNLTDNELLEIKDFNDLLKAQKRKEVKVC